MLENCYQIIYQISTDIAEPLKPTPPIRHNILLNANIIKSKSWQICLSPKKQWHIINKINKISNKLFIGQNLRHKRTNQCTYTILTIKTKK